MGSLTQNALFPSRTSRKVPPPTPVTVASRMKPNGSIPLRPATIAPVRAKIATPAASNTALVFGVVGRRLRCLRRTGRDADQRRAQDALADLVADLHDLGDQPLGDLGVGRLEH